MIRRFNFDNIISLIGAWFLFISTLSLYFVIGSFIDCLHSKKCSFGSSFFETFKESLFELTIDYWWSC